MATAHGATSAVVEFTKLDLEHGEANGGKKIMQVDVAVRDFSPLPQDQQAEGLCSDREHGKPKNHDPEDPSKPQGTSRDSAKTDSAEVNGISVTSPVQVFSSSNGMEASPPEKEKEMVAEPFGTVIRRAAILFLALLPAFALFMLAFTEIGFGATVFKYLAGASLASVVGAAGCLLFLILYILDVSYWRGAARVLRFLLLTLAGLCMIVALILTFRTRPYAPLLGYFVAIWLLCCMLYWRFFSAIHVVNYMQSLSLCLLLAASLGMAMALVWAGLNDFWWGAETKLEFRARLRVCEDMDACASYGNVGKACAAGCPEVEAESACAVDQDHCLAAFILFAGQFIVSLLTLVVAVPMLAVSRSLIAQSAVAEKGGGVPAKARIFGYATLVLVFMIWIASSIGGASMELSNVVTAFAVTLLALLVVMVPLAIGKSGREKLQGHEAVKKLAWVARHDAMKGLAMITVSVLLPLFFAVSWLNQLLRRSAFGRRFMKETTEEDRQLRLTAFGKRTLDNLRAWEWSQVLSWAVLLGFAYFILQVGVGKLTAVFLGWLNDYLKSSGLSFWVISAIIFLIGMVMFLVPAVPGVPVYVTTGVTLGAVGEEYLGAFVLAMLWATAVAFITKLAACAFQQKVIGEQMGASVWVKANVGLNSHSVKAIRLILQRPGLDRDKVMILVGGPDWPTSVLTGILRLPYLGMMIGTLPILLPVAFTTVAGGCMLKQDDGGVWVSMGSLFLTLSALSLGGCFIGAAIATQNVVSSQKEELEAIPDDPDVKLFNDSQADAQARTRQAMAWAGLPIWVRAVLVLAWLCMYVSFVAFAQFSDVCFEAVGVTTPYDEPPLNNNVLNVVKGKVGWGALAIHGLSLLLWQLFRTWVKHKAKQLPPTQPEETAGGGDGAGAGEPPAQAQGGAPDPGFSHDNLPPDLGVVTGGVAVAN